MAAILKEAVNDQRSQAGMPEGVNPPAVGQPSIEETARLLAREHVAEDNETQEVYWAPSDDDVLLVEVSPTAGTIGEALPFGFAPDPPEVPCRSVVILLSPEDWELVKSHQLELPRAFANLQQIYPEQSGIHGDS